VTKSSTDISGKRYKSQLGNRDQDPYQFQSNPLPLIKRNDSVSASLNSTSILPVLSQKSSHYYLAHSIDLSHPIDFVNVKIKERTKKDSVYYDNKRDQSKVQNKSYNPEEIADQLSSKHSEPIPVQERYNQNTSKDNLFQIGYFNKQCSRNIRFS